MAEENTPGWSEKGKGSGRGKRPPKDPKELSGTDAADTDASGDASDGGDKGSATPTRPSRRTRDDAPTGESSVVRTPASDDTGARKVAKAAATAGQRDVSFASRLGFPALIALICLLGIVVVFFAWNGREALAKPRQNVDHWHSVYGVYDCRIEGEDKYLPAFQSTDDASGIHSHGDGIIHVHPFFELSSGDNAQLRHFFTEMRIDVPTEGIADSIVLDSGAELTAGATCADGSTAEIYVYHWDFDFEVFDTDAPKDPVVYDRDLGLIKFDNDREVYIIALAEPGADLPLPPEDRFNQLDLVSSEQLEFNPDGPLTPQDSGIEAETDADAEEGDG